MLGMRFDSYMPCSHPTAREPALTQGPPCLPAPSSRQRGLPGVSVSGLGSRAPCSIVTSRPTRPTGVGGAFVFVASVGQACLLRPTSGGLVGGQGQA